MHLGRANRTPATGFAPLTFFTRNLVILRDNAGRTGVGEVPGGKRIRQTLEDARKSNM